MDTNPPNPATPNPKPQTNPAPAAIAPEGSGLETDKNQDRHLHELDRAVRTLTEQNARLQRLLIGVIAAIMLLCLGTGLFFFKQMRMARQQLAVHRQSASSTLRDFRFRIEPDIYRFASQLQDFAATNPDFRAVLDPFQPVLAPYFTTRGTGATPSSSPDNTAPPSN